MKNFTVLLLLLCSIGAWSQKPRYIFYFIGDGMGPEQVLLGGGDSLSFSKFPIQRTITTFSASDSITDSAAAGTALATGTKTSNGTIGMTADHSANVYSVAVAARQAGRRVGIITSVSLDHATPAAFYAHETSRKKMHQIAQWLPRAGFDLYAGAGFLDPKGLLQTFADSSYTMVYGAKNRPQYGERTIWIQDTTLNSAELPYASERVKGDLTLPIFVDGAIEALMGDNDGFFMMIEGGKIDWACHSNHAQKARAEVQDFAAAVDRAIKFYYEYPSQTLIVVTADHETGGLTVGNGLSTTWTTGDHTATNVPIYAIGLGAERFAKVKDNTDVPTILRSMMAPTVAH